MPKKPAWAMSSHSSRGKLEPSWSSRPSSSLALSLGYFASTQSRTVRRKSSSSELNLKSTPRPFVSPPAGGAHRVSNKRLIQLYPMVESRWRASSLTTISVATRVPVSGSTSCRKTTELSVKMAGSRTLGFASVSGSSRLVSPAL